MEIARPLPPRKNLTPTRISKQYLSPLQILLQSGFQRHRAEKALAATGHRSAQLAADWLLAHVNDPTLDSPCPREYIVYACPYGELLQQLELFSDKSFDECGRNGAHNFIPHVTLVSFFKAPDECSLQLAQTLEQVVKEELESNNSTTGFTLEPYMSPNFMGLFVPEDNATILKHIALQYVKEVSNDIINDNYEQLDAIATCFPWCTNATSRFSILPKSMQSISLEPHVKSLHLTLAYQFKAEHFETLKQLAQSIINTKFQAFWEIRLYSRDSRVVGKQVYKVIYSYSPKESDELELRIGDFIYVAEEANLNSSDGWVEGTSWLTGCTGFFPINYTQHTAETDSWTLHKSVPLFKRDLETEIMDLDGQNTDDICTSDLLTCDNASTASLCSLPANSSCNTEANSTCEKMKNVNDIYIMRHGERMDFCFGNWIPTCIDKDNKYIRKDLNMPVRLPKRHNYPNSFRDDTPLTNVGLQEARLTGEGLSMAGANIRHVVCSPALRCMQTCHNVLTGLGIANQLPIKVEGGLFEWLTWYQNGIPDWMTDEELIEAGFKIDTNYQALISREQMKDHMNESCSQFYDRSFKVMEHVLKLTENKDGAILVVGHASSLDTCSRQLRGLEPLSVDAMDRIMSNVPYCSLVQLRRLNSQWKLIEPPVPGCSHSANKRFDWRVILDE